MADAVPSLGLDLREFERSLNAANASLSKGAERAIRASQRVVAEAAREAAQAQRLQAQAAADAARTQLEALRAQQREQRRQAEETARIAAEAVRAQTEALREQQREEARLADEAARRAREQAAAARALAGLAAQTSETERLTHAYQEQLREIRRLVEVTGDHAAGEKAAAAAAAKHAKELDRVDREARGEAEALREAERAAREAARAAAEASKQTREGLKGLGELVGLPVDQVEKFGQAIGLVGGPLAAMAGGAAIATAAVGAAVAATVALVRAAIDLEAEVSPLRREGLLPPLPAGFADQLVEADDAMRGATTAAKALVAQIGAALAPAVEYGAVVVGNLVTSVMSSGETLRGFGQVVRAGVIVWLQSLIDYALRIPTLYARMAGVVGDALSSLGATEFGAQLRQVSDDLIGFKDSIGASVVDGVISDWTTGVTLMGREADLSGAAIKRLGAAQRALSDRSAADAGAGAAKAAKDAEAAAKKAAEAAAQWARDLGMVNAAAQDLGRLVPELQALAAELERVGQAGVAKAFADLDTGVQAFGDSVRSLVVDQLRAAGKAAREVGGALAGAAGIDLSGGPMQALLGVTTDAVKAEQAAAAAVAEARAELRAAVASGDSEAIAQAREGLRAARGELEAAQPTAFVKGLISGATDMVTAIVDALPGVVKGLVGAAPRLITALVDAIPQLIIALVRAAPQIAIDLATAFALELPIQLIAAAPKIAAGLAVGIGEGFVAAASRIKRVVGDIFKEIATGGRADTRTFGDTPGPVRVSSRGLDARFAPGDLVVAARTAEGLRAQTGARAGRQAATADRLELDLRDGPVRLGLARATRRAADQLGLGRDRTGRSSPYRMA